MSDARQDIAYELLEYLVENPDAQDTLEGIVEWWLFEQTIKQQTALVQMALTELVGMGVVLERKGKDARTYYKLNRRKLKEIRALLARFRGSSDPK